MKQLRAHLQVVIEELRGVRAVGAYPADDGGEMDHHVRSGGGIEALHRHL